MRSPDPAVQEAVRDAVGWIVDRARAQDDYSTTEQLEPEPEKPQVEILIKHFSATWCVRAMVGRPDVPAHRLAQSVDVIWDYFDSARENLWCWRSDVTFPSWMTLDAVSALRAAALTTFPTPLDEKSENDVAHAPPDREG